MQSLKVLGIVAVLVAFAGFADADSISLPKADNSLIVEALSDAGTLTISYTQSTGEFKLMDVGGTVDLYNAATAPNPTIGDLGVFTLDVSVNSTPHITGALSSPALVVDGSSAFAGSTTGEFFNGAVISGPNFEYNPGTKEFDLLFSQADSGSVLPQVKNGGAIGVQLFVSTTLSGTVGNFSGDFSANLTKADVFDVSSAPLPTTATAGIMLLVCAACLIVLARRAKNVAGV